MKYEYPLQEFLKSEEKNAYSTFYLFRLIKRREAHK